MHTIKFDNENCCTVRRSRFQMFFKISALKNFANFTGKQLCWSLFLIKLQLQLYQKEAPTQVFFCEIFKKTFFYRTPPVAASLL